MSDKKLSGPYAGYDANGRYDYDYYRCGACGFETVEQTCLRCADTEDEREQETPETATGAV